MAIKGRFPAIRPSLDLNFAKTKRLDPRITFTRASSGTYVGRDGLIKTAGVNEPRFDHNPTTGESLGLLVEEARTNLLPYSEDFSQADWVTFGTASKSSNVATAPDGNFTADSITLPAASGVLDNIPVSASTTYTFSVYIRGTPGTTIRILSNANSSGLVANTVTVSGVWQRYSVTFTTNSGDISTSIQFDSGGGNTFYVWGAQVEAGAFPTSHIPTVAATVTRAADVASITGSNFGTTRTNLLVRSEEFDNASWTKTRSSVTANAITAPNGTLTADELVEDTTVTSSHNIGQSISFTSGTTYTVSVFAKATASPRFLQIIFPSGGFTATRRPVFDLLNGIASAATDTTASIQNIGNGWYRCIGSMLATNTNSASIQLQLANTYTNSVSTYTGDGVSGVYIWGAQLEVGSAATPYIQSPSVFTSRASSGTYVGGNGLIQTAVTNLLLRSEEFDDASWTKTRSSIEANTIVAPDGTLTGDKLVDTTNASTTHVITQSFSFVSGTTYTTTLYAKQGEIRYVRLGFSATAFGAIQIGFFDLQDGVVTTTSGTVTTSITSVGNGWWRIRVSAAATVTTSDTISINLSVNGTSSSFTGNGFDGVYIWGAQLEQASTVGEYIPTTSTINSAARYDHDPVSLIGKGLLLEEARTNLLLRSEEFNDASWAKSAGTVSANSIASPAGAITADTFVENTSNALHRISRGGAVVSGLTYTTSVYAKYAGRFLYFNCNVMHAARATFDLQSGTVATVAAGSAAIVAMGNGWYRCSITGVAAATLTQSFYLQLNDTSVATDRTYTGDGTSGIYLWGAQLEAGAFPTSYIPTTTATVTRAADISTSVATSVFESSWYRQDEGTVFADVKTLSPQPDYFSTVFELQKSDNTDRLFVRYPNFVGWEAGGQTGSGLFISRSFRQQSKLSIGYKTNDTAFAANGSAASDTSATIGETKNEMYIGENGSGFTLNGHIRRLTYWPQRLSNATLQALTS
jgi:hypothetical protein